MPSLNTILSRTTKFFRPSLIRSKFPRFASASELLFVLGMECVRDVEMKCATSAHVSHSCSQHIEVNKLIKAKPLDNLEFLQWIKRYFDLHYGGNEYNAVDRRGGAGKENTAGNVAAKSGATKTVHISARTHSIACHRHLSAPEPSTHKNCNIALVVFGFQPHLCCAPGSGTCPHQGGA